MKFVLFLLRTKYQTMKSVACVISISQSETRRAKSDIVHFVGFAQKNAVDYYIVKVFFGIGVPTHSSPESCLLFRMVYPLFVITGFGFSGRGRIHRIGPHNKSRLNTHHPVCIEP